MRQVVGWVPAVILVGALGILVQASQGSAEVMAPGRSLVVLDPGHGGPDPGAIVPGRVAEKRLNLAITLQVARLLSRRGISVVLTRHRDTAALTTRRYVVVKDLRHRAWIARHVGATALVSIHANAEPSHTATGPIVYYHACSQSSHRLALAITGTLAATAHIYHSPRTCHHLLLRESPPALAAVTVEVGFLTHPSDLARLVDPRYQNQVALAITHGIQRFLTSP